MDIKKQFSDYFRLNGYDLLKGVVMTIGTTLLTMLYAKLSNNQLPTATELKGAAIAGAAAGIFYLLKNFFTNGSGQLAKSDDSQKP